MGIVSELVSVFSRKHIFGYPFIAFSSVAIAMFGFFVWGHHMFVSGQSPLVTVLFSLLTYSVSIPSAVRSSTSWRPCGGSISSRPMLYALGFVFLFGIGGLTGLFRSPGDRRPCTHVFVVSHFHYVMLNALIAMLGGMHYWWPDNRPDVRAAGVTAFVLVIIGFNLTFFRSSMGTTACRALLQYPPEFTFLISCPPPVHT